MSVPENMASYEKCRFVVIQFTTQTDSVSAINFRGILYIGEPVDISQESEKIPAEFVLYQNYLNPFNPSNKN